jgi:hypothetical protein
MWWECSECGGHLQCARPPAVCPECGTAGVIFMPAEVEEPLCGVPEVDGLRAVWLGAGLEKARTDLAV